MPNIWGNRCNLLTFACFIVINCVLVSTQNLLRRPLNGILDSNRLKSGPIFLVDNRIILVSQFTYENGPRKNLRRIYNKWFKGIRSAGPNVTEFVDLVFDNGTNAQLTETAYLGRNIYLRVKANSDYDVRNFIALAIINDKNEIKTSVPINYNDLIDLPDHLDVGDYLYKDGKFILRYPKCCPFGSYLDLECKIMEYNGDIDMYPVHEEKLGKYYKKPMTDISYEPFTHEASCEMFEFGIEDNITLLSNLELLKDFEPRIQLACMDYKPDEQGKFHEVIYVCTNFMEEMSSSLAAVSFNSSKLALLQIVALIMSLKLMKDISW